MTENAPTPEFAAPSPPPAADRREAIAEALARSSASPHHVPFHKGYIEAPVAAVDHRLLVYRAANGRLVSELAARGMAAEQRDDADQQQALHGLLIDKARDPSGPIYDELALHARQTEPLLVTAAGVVVNGNRRLAAMRELQARDADKYGRFAEVSIAVLPDTMDDDEIEYVEAALQMAPDLKLDYSWINRRLKLRDHVERLALPEADIMAAYRFEDPAAIERELDELAAAERYLRYREMPGRYDELTDLDELIIAMKRELGRISNKRLTELWTYAGFAMIAERERLDAQIERYFPFTRPAPFELIHWVMRSFGEEKGMFDPQRTGENNPIRPADAERLLPVLQDCANAPDVAGRIVALSDRLRANQEKEIGGAQILHHLRNAKEGLSHTGTAMISDAQAREIHAEIVALGDFLSLVSNDRGTPEREQGKSLFSRLFGSR